MKIKEIALKELEQEKFRHLVELEKQRLKRPWYVKFFPWRISIKFYRR